MIHITKMVATEEKMQQQSVQEQNTEKQNMVDGNKRVIVWQKVVGILLIHMTALYSLFYLAVYSVHTLTLIWTTIIIWLSGLGVTVGVHRLWTHKTYKAKPQLEVLLLVLFSLSGQNTVYQWVLDHRVHHKYSDTDADPHNSKRGFFYSHCGWLMLRKGPQVLQKGKQIDMSDIKSNPYIYWHTKFFIPLKILICFTIPVIVPVYFWNESWMTSFLFLDTLRYAIVLNSTWSVNSWAHIWGTKPYDKRICPVDSLPVAIFALGEGWHNYHHVFPWDYKTGEFGHYRTNLSTLFIDTMAKIGWAYDLKQPSEKLVQNVISKYGDLSKAPEQDEQH